MITGAIKNKVDKIWTDIWAGGIANPLTAVSYTHLDVYKRQGYEKAITNTTKE